MKALTSGRVSTELLTFAWPLVLSNLLQTLHNATDVLLAGRLLGKIAMSAITIGGQSILFLTACSLGLAAGGQILIARFKGANKQEEQTQTVSALLTCTLLLGIATAGLGFFGAPAILRLMQRPAEVLEGARQYMQITSM